MSKPRHSKGNLRTSQRTGIVAFDMRGRLVVDAAALVQKRLVTGEADAGRRLSNALKALKSRADNATASEPAPSALQAAVK